MSVAPFVSDATRFVAFDRKATSPPSPLSDGRHAKPLGEPPTGLTSTRSATPVASVRTNTPTDEQNATTRPSALMAGLNDGQFSCAPLMSRLTRTVVPACRSRRKMSL